MPKTLLQTILAAFCAILCATSMGGGGMRRRMMCGMGGWDNPYQTSDGALVSMFDGLINASRGRYVEGITQAYDVITGEYHPITTGVSFAYTDGKIVNNRSFADISNTSRTFANIRAALTTNDFSVMGSQEPLQSDLTSGVYYPYVSFASSQDRNALQLNNVNKLSNYYLGSRTYVNFATTIEGMVKSSFYAYVNSLVGLITQSGGAYYHNSTGRETACDSIDLIRLFNSTNEIGNVSCQYLNIFTLRFYNRNLTSSEIDMYKEMDRDRFSLW